MEDKRKQTRSDNEKDEALITHLVLDGTKDEDE